jgi:NAD(P)-dependent dehydrogenase (short-subunit alcohol dehydrogenase family)
MDARRVVIVTGAGSGIGREAARQLDAAGFRGSLVGRRMAALRDTAALLQRGWRTIASDLSDPAAAAGIVDATLAAFGSVDGLVNNAAIAARVPIQDTTPELLRALFAANVFGPAILIARLWPVLAARGGGCIVNVSSMAAVSPFPGLSAYAASKCALESLTRSIMTEAAAQGLAGIRAFSVAPGAVETPMLRSMYSTRDVPREATLDPAAVAQVIVECVRGLRDAASGSTILLPSP